jgi:hypothetical protein
VVVAGFIGDTQFALDGLPSQPDQKKPLLIG